METTLTSTKEYVRDNVAAFGGDASKVTLAGQSSGASLVKTLLTVPSADELFSRAILHSAPLDYPDQTPSVANTLGSASLVALGCTDVACLQKLSVKEILAAQERIFANATSISPAINQFQPFSPVVDGELVKQDFIKAINGDGGGLTNKRREIIFTTVRDEAGCVPTSSLISPLRELNGFSTVQRDDQRHLHYADAA